VLYTVEGLADPGDLIFDRKGPKTCMGISLRVGVVLTHSLRDPHPLIQRTLSHLSELDHPANIGTSAGHGSNMKPTFWSRLMDRAAFSLWSEHEAVSPPASPIRQLPPI
jgi:hypothetical protein